MKAGNFYFSELDPGQRSDGLSSRIRRVANPTHVWQLDSGTSIEMPVIVDYVMKNPATGQFDFIVEAYVGMYNNHPKLMRVIVESECGLDAELLQREFLWRSPEVIVQRGLPRLVAEGQNPFDFDLPIDGFPDAAEVVRRPKQRLDDHFLEDIAREYLSGGRGYANEMAAKYFVSPRTVISWVEKARARGILTKVTKGGFGGKIVPLNKRKRASKSRDLT